MQYLNHVFSGILRNWMNDIECNISYEKLYKIDDKIPAQRVISAPAQVPRSTEPENIGNMQYYASFCIKMCL